MVKDNCYCIVRVPERNASVERLILDLIPNLADPMTQKNFVTICEPILYFGTYSYLSNKAQGLIRLIEGLNPTMNFFSIYTTKQLADQLVGTDAKGEKCLLYEIKGDAETKLVFPEGQCEMASVSQINEIFENLKYTLSPQEQEFFYEKFLKTDSP